MHDVWILENNRDTPRQKGYPCILLLYGDIINTDISRIIQTVCSRIRTLEVEFHTLHPSALISQ